MATTWTPSLELTVARQRERGEMREVNQGWT